VPSHVGIDRGGENLHIKDAIEQRHGVGRGTAIQGPSVQNQRIESLWPLVKKDVIHPYKDLLKFTLLQ
jgi:hypothetical protein